MHHTPHECAYDWHNFAGRISDLHMNSCIILYKSLHKFYGITIDEELLYRTLLETKVQKVQALQLKLHMMAFLHGICWIILLNGVI